MIFVTEINQSLGFESCYIFSDDFGGEPKSGQNVGLKEVYYDSINGLSQGYGLYPFGKVICSSENPFMLGRGRWMDFTNEVKTPLLKWCFSRYWLQR